MTVCAHVCAHVSVCGCMKKERRKGWIFFASNLVSNSIVGLSFVQLCGR